MAGRRKKAKPKEDGRFQQRSLQEYGQEEPLVHHSPLLRDDPQVESRVVNELRTDEQILQSQEQLKKEYDDDDYDDDQTWDDIDSLDIQIADKEAMDVMTNEEKELVDLFHKSLGTLPSADETSGPTSIPSVRGNEDYKVKSEIDEDDV